MAMVLALWLVGCSAPPNDSRAPLIQSLAWKMDTSGQATLKDIKATPDWQTFDGIKNWGFGTAPIWVRYSLRAALPGETEPWIVRIRPAFLEQLTLYDPVGEQEWHSGLAMDRKDDALGSINFTFQVPALSQARDIYLRLETRSSRLVLTDALPLNEAIAQNRSEEWLLGFLVSISTAFALWASMQWVLGRERVMGAFAIKQWIATVWALTSMGFTRVLLTERMDPDIQGLVESFIRVWTLAATLWFLLMLIRDYRPAQAWLRTCHAYFVLILLLPLLVVADLALAMRFLSNIAVPLGLVLVLATLLSTPKIGVQPSIPRVFLVFYLSLYTVINSVPSLIYLNVIPLHALTQKGHLAHILMDGLVMFLMLQLRARNMAAHTQRMTEHNLSIARQLDRAQQGMEFEQRRRQEQSQFLHMLMHELKTPLSIVSLALGNRNKREENLAHASRAVQDMKAIIERCVQADQVGELQLTQHRKTVDVARLIRQQMPSMPLLAPRLHLLSPGHVPLLRTDEQLLQIILSNLLDNAAHYSDPLTPVTVELGTPDQTGLSVRVRNVPGLAGWPDAQKVFSKYYRASGAQRESGSGLGLFLSRQLAQSLGGTLNYEPDQQHVEFVLWIPLHPA